MSENFSGFGEPSLSNSSSVQAKKRKKVIPEETENRAKPTDQDQRQEWEQEWEDEDSNADPGEQGPQTVANMLAQLYGCPPEQCCCATRNLGHQNWLDKFEVDPAKASQDGLYVALPLRKNILRWQKKDTISDIHVQKTGVYGTLDSLKNDEARFKKALTMALAAKSNPRLRGGVAVHGSETEKAFFILAAQIMELDVTNVDPVKDKALLEKAGDLGRSRKMEKTLQTFIAQLNAVPSGAPAAAQHQKHGFKRDTARETPNAAPQNQNPPKQQDQDNVPDGADFDTAAKQYARQERVIRSPEIQDAPVEKNDSTLKKNYNVLSEGRNILDSLRKTFTQQMGRLKNVQVQHNKTSEEPPIIP